LDNEDSFGLSAWTLEKARGHCGELGKVFKVRIAVEDVAALVHEGKKLRCTRLTVLEEMS